MGSYFISIKPYNCRKKRFSRKKSKGISILVHPPERLMNDPSKPNA